MESVFSLISDKKINQLEKSFQLQQDILVIHFEYYGGFYYVNISNGEQSVGLVSDLKTLTKVNSEFIKKVALERGWVESDTDYVVFEDEVKKAFWTVFNQFSVERKI